MVTRPASSGFARFLRSLGPGLVTGASDDDPSGIGTYSLAGASLGFATLWTAVVTLPLMIAVQFICAKIGMASGRGLASVLRVFYPRSIVYPAVACLLVANTLNAAADLGAIAAAIGLVVPVRPAWLLVPIAAAILGLQLWGRYRLIVGIFKWLTVSLLAYVAAAFLARPDWGAVLAGTFRPTLSLDRDYLVTLVAILGTTISPYLFFWQASQEVEEDVGRGRLSVDHRKGTTDAELRRARLDTITGMFFCNLVFYFVILACAATLHATGHTDIQSAAEAAAALRPVAGEAAGYLFALGIIGAGFLAVPVLTASSAYAVAEAFAWRVGLDRRLGEAPGFYAVIAVSTLVALAIDFAGINPIRALFWSAVLNGLLAPPLLVLIMLVANNPDAMGRHVNGRLANVAGWTTTALMFAAAAALAVS
ncbi:MAG: divalent metal cation transporter [Betaproteobacteria bacterium]|nr:divalent metal cation transporter [Betaproteobacteria bacterium]